jgi:hypothetical protein
MSNIYTPAQIEQFKRDATRLARRESLTHAVALDQIAAVRGYSNWSLLVKLAASHQRDAVSPRPERPPHLLVRTTEAMRQAMRKTTPAPGNGSSHDRLRAQIEDLSAQFISAENALDFAITYMERALDVARFSVHSQSLTYYEMRCWLPYCVHVVAGNAYVLLGRDYKPVGMVQKKDHVDYADFPQTHLYVTKQQLRQQVTVYREDSAEGYLYDASPWASRKHAQSYLNHLKKLRNWLSSRKD